MKKRSGGWPMSVFLTPERKPFFGATYFPPADFRKLLGQVSEVWKNRRPDLEKSADQIVEAMRRQMRTAAASARLPKLTVINDLVADLRSSFDQQHAGFSKAPKFPPH